MSEVFSVQQKEGKLREKPSFLGKILKSLSYGTKVSVENKQGAWFQVSVSGSKGWLHKSSLTEKEIVLNAGDKRVSSDVSDDELVLAGKGFSEQVEKSYRQENPAINFGLVDKMEAYSVNPDKLASFVKDGDLTNV